MSDNATRCAVCTAHYNPITNSEQCPHRQLSHTVIDPSPEVEDSFISALHDGSAGSLDRGNAERKISTLIASLNQSQLSEYRTKPIELPAPGRILYLYLLVEHDGIQEARFIAPAMVVSSLGCTALEPIHHGTTVLLRRMDEPSQGEGCLDPVSLFEHISKIEYPGGVGWDWMPYQKGQAKKLEEIQSIEWMGLRTEPSHDELNNRFSYHPPKPGQPDTYERIRSKAHDFARELIGSCPPSPELASALDHLDTVVFKANASIARHG